MKAQLLIMRHAKSDWNLPVVDFDRPLNARGRAALESMGRWLQTQNLQINALYSSPAKRAASTATGIAPFVDYSPDAIHWEPRLYHASLDTLLLLLADWLVEDRTILLVGHNPGLESLVLHLSPPNVFKTRVKTFPTAAFANMTLRLPDRVLDADRWFDVTHGCAELNTLKFPKEL
jgi:phosphohistidine phosphatase